MDVEGNEWPALSNAKDVTLKRFDQIAIEIHELKSLATPDFRSQVAAALEKLNRSFTLCHVHANNATPIATVDGLVVASTLELLYVKSSTVTATASTTLYPTALDFQNVPRTSDLLLWFFPFLPTTVPMPQLASDSSRVVHMHATKRVTRRLQDELKKAMASDLSE